MKKAIRYLREKKIETLCKVFKRPASKESIIKLEEGMPNLLEPSKYMMEALRIAQQEIAEEICKEFRSRINHLISVPKKVYQVIDFVEKQHCGDKE